MEAALSLLLAFSLFLCPLLISFSLSFSTGADDSPPSERLSLAIAAEVEVEVEVRLLLLVLGERGERGEVESVGEAMLTGGRGGERRGDRGAGGDEGAV